MTDAINAQLKLLLVEALMLDDVEPSSIEDDAPLFGEGLGLDSIDALELAIAIERRFGVRIEADDERNRRIFGSVSSLASHIRANRPVIEETVS